MTLSKRAVEAAARACYEHEPQSHHTREIHWDELGQGTRDRFMHKATATITAALAVDGLCLVPRDPTQEMIEAAWADALAEDAAGVWAAMIAAASDGEEPK